VPPLTTRNLNAMAQTKPSVNYPLLVEALVESLTEAIAAAELIVRLGEAYVNPPKTGLPTIQRLSPNEVIAEMYAATNFVRKARLTLEETKRCQQ
jgi:hypothetical protein